MSSKGRLDKRKGNAVTSASFVELVDRYRYADGPTPEPRKLTNFTIWAGAGFSKSWNPNAPDGATLFTLEVASIDKVATVGALYRMFGLDYIEEIEPDQLRQIIYQLEMYEKYPDVRPRYVDDHNIRMFKAALISSIVHRYCGLTELNYFDSAINKFPFTSPTSAQKHMVGFFRYLFDQLDGSQPLVEGIRTHFVTTNYDYVIETILDNVLGFDDSLFLYTYRGITPTQVAGQYNIVPVHGHWLTWHLLKMNGGFEILRKEDKFVLDYSRRSTDDVLVDPPVLMLPSREQDYRDPYFRAIFPKAVRLLRETQILVLVGYSLPEDDALIRFILRQFAEEGEDGREKVLFYVGRSFKKEREEAIERVFPSLRLEGCHAPKLHVYVGEFHKFAADCLKLVKEERKRRRKIIGRRRLSNKN